MGCDIHPYVECRNPSGAWEYDGIDVWDYRSYHLFGWLADVRNHSAVPPISEPRGVPGDLSAEVRERWESWSDEGFSASWLSLDELLVYAYDVPMEDRRIAGGRTAEPGGGKMTTYREFLGPTYFADLDKLTLLAEGCPLRVVFWFDN